MILKPCITGKGCSYIDFLRRDFDLNNIHPLPKKKNFRNTRYSYNMCLFPENEMNFLS